MEGAKRSTSGTGAETGAESNALKQTFSVFKVFHFLCGLSNHLLNHRRIHPKPFIHGRSTKGPRLSRLSFPSTSYRPSTALPSLKPLTHKAPVHKPPTYPQAIHPSTNHPHAHTHKPQSAKRAYSVNTKGYSSNMHNRSIKKSLQQALISS